MSFLKRVAFAWLGLAVVLLCAADGVAQSNREKVEPPGSNQEEAGELVVQPLRVLQERGSEANALQFSPNSRFLASAHNDGTVRLWQPETGRLRRTLQVSSGAVFVVAFSPDSRWLATVSKEGVIKLWEPSSGREVHTLTSAGARMYALAFSADSALLAARGGDERKVWDVATGRERPFAESDAELFAPGVLSPDKRWQAEVAQQGGLARAVRVLERKTGREAWNRVENFPVYQVAFSQNGRWLAEAGKSDGTVFVFEARTGDLARVILAHHGRAKRLAFSSNGRWLATAGADFAIKLWDVSAWQ